MTITSRAAAGCGAVLVAVAGCASGSAPAEPSPPSAVSATTERGSRPPSSRPAGRWSALLHRLDLRRGHAFVRGDPSLLDRVYAPGSAVRRSDARLVRAYVRRGLEVDEVRLSLDAVDLVRRTPSAVSLRVVDRLRPVRVRARGGSWHALPHDRLTERVVTFRRLAAGWRIAGVRRVAG